MSRGDLGVQVTGPGFFDPGNSSRNSTPTIPVLEEGNMRNGYRGISKPSAARTARSSLYEKPVYGRYDESESLPMMSNMAYGKEIGVAVSPPIPASTPSTMSRPSSLRTMTTYTTGEIPMTGVVPGGAPRTKSVVFDKPHYARVNPGDMIPRAKSVVYEGPSAYRAGPVPAMPRINTYEKKQYVSASAKTKEAEVPTVVVSPVNGDDHDGSKDADKKRVGAVSPEMHLWTPDENGVKKIG